MYVRFVLMGLKELITQSHQRKGVLTGGAGPTRLWDLRQKKAVFGGICVEFCLMRIRTEAKSRLCTYLQDSFTFFLI